MRKINTNQYKIEQVQHLRTDWIVPICMFVLFLIGVIFIYSTQSYNIEGTSLKNQFWFKQIFYFLCIGLPVYAALGYFDYKWVFDYSKFIYAASLLLLIPLVLKENFGLPIPFVESRFNATRWINFGVFSIQPSEIAKIGTCVMAAAMMSRKKIRTFREDWLFWLKLSLVFFVPILLIYLQPDLGSTLVFFPMLFAMFYISKLPRRFFALSLLVFGFFIALVSFDILGYTNFLESENISARESARRNAYGSSALCLPMKDYQRNRILAFVAPDVVDPRGTDVSWNLRQSLISVGTGGVFGKGIAEGTQAKLGYLPSSVAYNDFIFSVIAEESGFLGATLALLLIAIIVLGGCLRAASLSRDKFGQFLCVGIAAILMTHSFINVGMTIGVMPITGLPLPMLSYGGTFVLTCCILLGLVQSVFRHRKEYI